MNNELEGNDFIGELVRVYWESENDWLQGVIDDYDTLKGYHVQYFEADDEWLPTLKADNVELENEARRGQGKKNRSSKPILPKGNDSNEMESTSELKVITDSKSTPSNKKSPKYRGGPDFDNTEVSVPLEEYTEQYELLRDTVSSELSKLTSHSVLLVGNVLEANIASSGSKEADDDCKIYFKVLFIEGGQQPAMFRCKTPVYSSEGVSNLLNPKWQDSQFRFDMIMPQMQGAKTTLQLQGEVLIGFYQTRVNGGNDMIGQLSFDLAEMGAIGTVDFIESGYEIRNVHGTHTILSRSKEEVGEAEVLLSVAWQSPADTTDDDDVRSINRTRKGPNNDSRSKIGLSGKFTTFTQTKASKPPEQRKIVSAQLRKQKEDVLRIERENKALQSRLKQHATKNGGSKAAESIYTGNGTSPAAGLKMDRNQSQNGFAAAEAKTPRRSNVTTQSKEEATLQSLVKMLTELKKDVALGERENQTLRSKLLKLRTQHGKYAGSLEKMKGRGSGMLRVGDSYSSSMAHSRDDHADRLLSHSPVSHASSSSSQHQQQQQRPLSARSNASNHRQVNIESKVKEADPLMDSELRGLLEEHEVLQNVRRALVGRINQASQRYQETVQESKAYSAKRVLAEKRMHYFMNGVNYIDSSEMEVSPSDEDFQLFDRHRSSLRDLLRYEALLDEKLHLVSVESGLGELQAVVKALKKQSELLHSQVGELKKQKEKHTTGLKKIIESSRVHRMREFLTFMQSLLLRFERNERLAVLDESYNNTQLELLRLQNRLRIRNEERLLGGYT